MRASPWILLVVAASLVGLAFAGVSTYDSVQHLDRQVHDIHCSFIPGLDQDSPAKESGCKVAMMSPYSSIWRTSVWGGIPIALPAMAVFAFLVFFAADLISSGRQEDPRATAFLVLACALPAMTSVVMAYLSLSRLGTTCKLCVGIYAASGMSLLGALLAWRAARERLDVAPAPPRAPERRDREGDPAWTGKGGGAQGAPAMRTSAALLSRTSWAVLIGVFAVGVAFVVLPVALYAGTAPRHERFVGTCGALAVVDDPYGVMVTMGRSEPGAAPAIEILDPLCPSCRAFETRLDQSGLTSKLARRAVLFPLDHSCNWMVEETMHPGACTVSEAVLCAGDGADQVLAWAFAEQARILAESEKDPGAATRLVKQRFPELAACVGSPAVKSRLNKSLRWAVQNSVPVLTPQLYVDGVKLCDEDVDLGLEYTLTAMLKKHASGQLKGLAPAPAPVAAPAPPPVAAGPAAPAAPAPATTTPAPPAAEPHPKQVPLAAEPPAKEEPPASEPAATAPPAAPKEAAPPPPPEAPSPEPQAPAPVPAPETPTGGAP